MPKLAEGNLLSLGESAGCRRAKAAGRRGIRAADRAPEPEPESKNAPGQLSYSAGRMLANECMRTRARALLGQPWTRGRGPQIRIPSPPPLRLSL